MLEIKGTVTTARCYATVIEEEAIAQIRRMCNHAFTEGSKVRIMPDVHAGKGCTIGTTMTVHDKVVPNIVGVDIGCGMYTVTLGKVAIDFAQLDAAVHTLPSGRDVWDVPTEPFDLQSLRCHAQLRHTQRLQQSLGTLGGGNHFIEIDESRDNTRYLVMHSGSRNLGKQVAEYYQNLAIELHAGKNDYPQARAALVQTYQAQGRQREIQAALKALEREYKQKTPDMPADLCYLSGAELADYLHDVEICQAFARRSREIMAHKILSLTHLPALDAFHTVHNYIDTSENILRKGAIAAHAGERVLIPINMRDGSILAIGKGNPEWNYSAPHGAGRLMSRTKARESLNMADYAQAIQGIYTTSANDATLDEAPMAYKSLSDVLQVIDAAVDVQEVLKPIYNFKAAE